MKINIMASAILVSTSLISCRPSQQRVDRFTEDGVEVIVNHFRSRSVADKLRPLALTETLTIDFENPDVVNIGIKNISGFDTDSHGDIYIWSARSSGFFVFKFTPSGEYVRSFGREGQGPGEIVEPTYLRVNEKDEILISDISRKKLITFNTKGEFISEMELVPSHTVATLLPNGNILAMRTTFDPVEGVAEMPIILCDKNLKEIATLYQGQKIPNWARAKRINALATNPSVPPWSIAQEHIYIGNKEAPYEFLVYDLSGTMLKKIRKEYNAVPIPKELRQQVMQVFERSDFERLNIKKKVFFPDYMPSYQYFFTDNLGRLFVMTFEKGEGPREYLYDIFDIDGNYIGRTSLGNSGNELNEIWGGPFDARAKNSRLFCMKVKESGYQLLVIYEMKWEN